MDDSPKITNTDIYELLQKLTKQNAEISKDVKEIKQKADIQNKEILSLQNRLIDLEKKNEALENRLHQTEISLKKNNLVIFGLPEKENENLNEEVHTLINNKLNVPFEVNDVDILHRIGKVQDNKTRPVLLKVSKYITKSNILKNVSSLKGSSIAIANDLTTGQQQDQKILYKHYKEAKQKNLNPKIRGNKLVVNGVYYTIEELDHKDIQNDQNNLDPTEGEQKQEDKTETTSKVDKPPPKPNESEVKKTITTRNATRNKSSNSR